MKQSMTGFLVFCFGVFLALASLTAKADVTLYSNSTTQLGRVENVVCSTGMTCTKSGQVGTLVATGTSATPTITGGTANGLVIGTTTPAAANFTTVYATGNVGLGTSVPGTKLAVGTTGQFTSDASGNLSTSGTLAAGATTITGALKATGNVGIGTTGVASKLLNVGSAGQLTVSSAGLIVDTALYGASAGSGGNRTLCVSADGVVFSSATACP